MTHPMLPYIRENTPSGILITRHGSIAYGDPCITSHGRGVLTNASVSGAEVTVEGRQVRCPVLDVRPVER